MPRFVHEGSDVEVLQFLESTTVRSVNVGVLKLCLYSIPVRCGNTRFRGQIPGDFSAILEGHGGTADSEDCERNPFGRDVLRRW